MKKIIVKSKYFGLLVLILLLGNSFMVNAQNFIRGVVKDSTLQKPIPNVEVILAKTGQGTTTDENGNFSLNIKSAKKAKITFSCMGYKSVDRSVKAGEQFSVILAEKAKLIKEIQITHSVKQKQEATPLEIATLEPRSLRTTTQVISSDDIQAIGATNMYEAMKYTVGGSLSEMGRKRRLFYTCRGQSSETAIDGISIYQFTDITSAISTSMIGHVENIRSSNALFFGYSGLSGVINLHTKSFDKFTTTGNFSYGTFNKIHANITNGGKFGNFGYAVSITKDKTDGPDNRNGAEDMWNLYGNVSYELPGIFSIKVQHFYMDGMREFAQMQAGKYNVPLGRLAMIWKYDPLKYNVTLAKAKIYEGKSANTELQFYNVDAKRTWNRRAYAVVKVANPNNPGKKMPVLTDSVPSGYPVAKEPYKVIGGGIFQTVSPVENNYLRIGLTGSKYTYPSNMNYYGATSDVDIRSFTGVLIDEHDFGKVSVNAGLKVLRDYYKRYAPGSSSVYIEDEWQPTTINGSLGASYSVCEKVVLNAQLSAGGINANSRAAKMVITNGDTTGTSVKDESRINLDLGVAADFGKAGKFTLTGFFTKRENALEYTGVLYTDNLGVENEYMDNIDTRVFGAELVWTSPVYGKWFSANANMTLMRTVETTNGKDERYKQSPEAMINGGIKAEKYGFTFTTNAKYVNRYIGDRFIQLSSPDQKVYIGDYFNIDMVLNYKMPKYPVSVFGRVINLTDKRFATMTAVYPDYGRRFSIGAKFEL